MIILRELTDGGGGGRETEWAAAGGMASEQVSNQFPAEYARVRRVGFFLLFPAPLYSHACPLENINYLGIKLIKQPAMDTVKTEAG